MKFYVECRNRMDDGDIDVAQFLGFDGFSRDIANDIFKRECKKGHDAVYLCKVHNGLETTVKTWYKETL